jgi:hypothetical protein
MRTLTSNVGNHATRFGVLPSVGERRYNYFIPSEFFNLFSPVGDIMARKLMVVRH